MFREQLALLDRREFILRINDLEKLKMQMQRCWSFVSAFTSGTSSNSQPLPNTEIPSNVSNIPAPATTATDYGSQARSQSISTGTPDFVGATMKAGLTVNDLKPPPVKKRRTESPAGTPPNGAATQGQSKAVGATLDQSSAPGTGTYASPIALDSPPAPVKKALPVLEGQGQPMAVKPTKGPKKGAAQNKSASQSAVPASPNKPVKAKAKKAAAQQPVSEDISVPEIPMTITPAATPLVIPLQETPISHQQQEETLKRKRELEEAQNDPAAFTERMLSSLLLPQQEVTQQALNNSITKTTLPAEVLSFLNDQGLVEPSRTTFAEPAPPSSGEVKQRMKIQSGGLNLIFDGSAEGSTSHIPSFSRWFQDTPSVTAETPELSQSDDPTKTSPTDHESVVTPSDSLQTARTATVSTGVPRDISSSTKSILSSFDKEYEELFKALTAPSNLPTDVNGSPEDMAWSWESGPVKVA